MSTWAIGDVQGCWKTLRALLRRLGYPRRGQRLWLAGDLVNRGPGSLDVLRWAADQGERVVAVLGNHDVHLLLVAAGLRERRGGDTLDRLLRARDRDELLGWLAARPLVHRQGRYLMVHGGLWPAWTPAEAVRLSRQASARVQDGSALRALAEWQPARAWDPARRGAERDAAFIRLVTTLRVVDERGAPVKFAGPPDAAPRGAVPWYAARGRRSRRVCVVFGHWAAHDLALGRDYIAVDSGCVWGRALSAVRLAERREDRLVVQEPARDGAAED